ncbi:MAG: AAA family ATPase, partial [Candidatus Odinarchaeota archaeon]
LTIDKRKYQREIDKVNTRISALNEKMNKLKLKRERADTELMTVINEINEGEIEILPQEKVNIEQIEPEKLLKEINKALEAKKKLEPVNMLAIDEHGKVSLRCSELIERRDVIEEERQVIVDFINQIENEKRNVFLKLFNSVNRKFNNLFGELSKNGTTRLILENAEDPFEGGVMIEANPEGKQVASLESMSGGEKALTALAFIFAIQQEEEQPFYVLDEIDAALDPMNVDRVGKLIHRLSRKMSDSEKVRSGAQFLVISHRDILMAKSDRIYGVTNVEGLSEIFPVKMTEKGFQKVEA